MSYDHLVGEIRDVRTIRSFLRHELYQTKLQMRFNVDLTFNCNTKKIENNISKLDEIAVVTFF